MKTNSVVQKLMRAFGPITEIDHAFLHLNVFFFFAYLTLVNILEEEVVFRDL